MGHWPTDGQLKTLSVMGEHTWMSTLEIAQLAGISTVAAARHLSALARHDPFLVTRGAVDEHFGTPARYCHWLMTAHGSSWIRRISA